MSESSPKKVSRLGRILGVLGFMAVTREITWQPEDRRLRHRGSYHSGVFYHGNPIYFPKRKKFKGSDKPMAKRNTYKKFKKYA